MLVVRAMLISSPVYNCGFPFSAVLAPWEYVALVLILLLLSTYMFFISGLWRKHLSLSVLGFSLIYLGAFYNLGSLLVFGCVPDPYPFFNLFHFNFADVFVTFGVFLIFFVA